MILRDDATAVAVAAANAKLAAEALLRGTCRRLGADAARELEVVALCCDVDSRALSVLRRGWYQHSTYFFE
jgi:hypothetical protein